MKYAIIENGKVVNVVVSDSALSDNWVQSDTAAIGQLYDGEFHDPPIPIPQEVTALQGLLAIDGAGLSSAYDSWANDPSRTFAEKAFISKAQTWRRDDPVLLAGATELGLDSIAIDGLFVAAAKL